MLNRDQIIKKLKATLDPDRFEHSLRVEKIALALGKKHRLNQKSLSIAALLHDCARRYGRRQLLRIAKRRGIGIDPVKKFEPKLFHGEIGAVVAKKEFGIKNREILRAIERHTTGAPGMSAFEKIIYLADHVEEGREFPGVSKLRRMAFKDLDRAIYESTTAMLIFLLEHDLPVYKGTVDTRNYFMQKL